MRPDAVRRAEVRQEDRGWIPRLYADRAVHPQLHVDIGRRRWWPHVVTLDADARDVADKRDAARSSKKLT